MIYFDFTLTQSLLKCNKKETLNVRVERHAEDAISGAVNVYKYIKQIRNYQSPSIWKFEDTVRSVLKV